MRFLSTVALASAAFVSAATASGVLNERFVQTLEKRQQFTPTTQTASGDTCADAFGDGYVVCREATDTQNRLCYDPSAGQTCCSSSWACPSDSFCYTSGNCCPNGLSQSACDAQISSSSSVAAKASATPTYSSGPYPAGNVTVQPTGTGSKTPPAQFTGAAAALSLEMGVAALGGVVAVVGALL